MVRNGSADTVVRAMNVKHRKWRLGGGPVTTKPLNCMRLARLLSVRHPLSIRTYCCDKALGRGGKLFTRISE